MPYVTKFSSYHEEAWRATIALNNMAVMMHERGAHDQAHEVLRDASMIMVAAPDGPEEIETLNLRMTVHRANASLASLPSVASKDVSVLSCEVKELIESVLNSSRSTSPCAPRPQFRFIRFENFSAMPEPNLTSHEGMLGSIVIYNLALSHIHRLAQPEHQGTAQSDRATAFVLLDLSNRILFPSAYVDSSYFTIFRVLLVRTAVHLSSTQGPPEDVVVYDQIDEVLRGFVRDMSSKLDPYYVESTAPAA